ncbi:hypothetical protein L7F22_029533 [Adiantum nelumboides]|nr:hypothetical protein [Adiantum nelumboides]
MEDVAPRRRRAQRSPTPTKRKRSPHSPHRRESKREENNSKKKKERKRSPSSPSSSPSSSSDEGSGYSSQERQRRGHRRSYAAWKRSSKLKKFKEGGKNISFLTYDGGKLGACLAPPIRTAVASTLDPVVSKCLRTSPLHCSNSRLQVVLRTVCLLLPPEQSKAMSPHVLLPDGYAACHAVIGDAINRCRHSDNLSRITIVVKHLENSSPSLLSSFEVLVSDTGPGISHEEVSKLFHGFSSTHLTHLCDAPLFWGGEMVILTSELLETEIRQYHVRDAFNQPTIMQLRSLSKDCGRFSGSSITVNFKGYPSELLLYICDICHQIKILMLKTVAVEVCVERLTSSESTVSEDVLLICEGLTLPTEHSSLDRLSVGVAGYASRSLNSNGASPEIGKALAASSESSTETYWLFEACIAVTEATENGDTSMDTELKETKILFFQDFICTAVTPTIVQVLKTKVIWESFGLQVKDVQLKETGTAIIQWGGPTRLESIELALHRYRNCQTKAASWLREVSVCKRCIEDALNDLKHRNPHLFMSHRSSELQKYVPDLSRCLSKLISSSSDVAFKAICAQILGLVSTDFNEVESCIRAKVLQVVEDLDMQSSKEQKKLASNKLCNEREADEPSVLDDDGEGDGYDGSEGNSIWEYL